jgi:ribulose-5-phosphate 4-epimerase/fuculose-1-phosphate aldolase
MPTRQWPRDLVLPEWISWTTCSRKLFSSLGGVPLVPYAMPGTPARGDALEPFLSHHDGFLLANHGATTVGSTLTQAHQRMESLEDAARIMLTARSVGTVKPLAPRDVQALRAACVAALQVLQQQTQTRSYESE